MRYALAVRLGPVMMFATLPVCSAAQELPAGVASAAELRARGVELGYNLDYEEALAAFQASIAADPAHPAGYRLAAATMWIRELSRRGAITAEDFLGQAGGDVGPAPEVERAIRDALDRAVHHDGVNRRATNLEARYQIGAAHGLLASYIVTIEGSVTRSFGPARSAFREHQHVLDLDQSRKDAGLIVGTYRYVISTLPVWSRLLARTAGLPGNRDQGIRLIEAAADHPGETQPKALFSLIVIYNREGRYADAVRVIERLQQRYPRNRLLWLEAAGTALRARRLDLACDAIARGLGMLAADARPRAFGEMARWRYLHGATLAGTKDWDSAARQFRLAIEDEGPEWLRARARVELAAARTAGAK